VRSAITLFVVSCALTVAVCCELNLSLSVVHATLYCCKCPQWL